MNRLNGHEPKQHPTPEEWVAMIAAIANYFREMADSINPVNSHAQGFKSGLRFAAMHVDGIVRQLEEARGQDVEKFRGPTP